MDSHNSHLDSIIEELADYDPDDVLNHLLTHHFDRQDDAIRVACNSAEEATQIVQMLAEKDRHFHIEQVPINTPTGDYSHTEVIAIRLHITSNGEWFSADVPQDITLDLRPIPFSIFDKETEPKGNHPQTNIQKPVQSVLIAAETVYSPNPDYTIIERVDVDTARMDSPTIDEVGIKAVKQSERLDQFERDEIVDDTVRVYLVDTKSTKILPALVREDLKQTWG